MTTTDKLTDEALVHRAVLDWIKEDAPIGIKMQMTPDLANKLSDRIAHRRASQAAPAPSDGLREENERLRGELDWIGNHMVMSMALNESDLIRAMKARARAALTPAPAQEGVE
ncbi:hypothetical protein CP157_01098 [Paracoccus marcusii]|uniref:hypothetical protein n=1 Tax=Paracoccus marcusii TaxID=59779 RepID=UPI001C3D7AE2|nr:hypothetical protein [Paracoccus marcusii]QXI63380.1 hypothetical protein CP157_01098 [Paracoccus marcusii]